MIIQRSHSRPYKHVQLTPNYPSQLTSCLQAHLTLLRMYVAVYDALGARPKTNGPTFSSPEPPQQQQARLDYYLGVVHYRYTLYLDMLVVAKDGNRQEYPEIPLPPWYVATYQTTEDDLLVQGRCTHDAYTSPLSSQICEGYRERSSICHTCWHRRLPAPSDVGQNPEQKYQSRRG